MAKTSIFHAVEREVLAGKKRCAALLTPLLPSPETKEDVAMRAHVSLTVMASFGTAIKKTVQDCRTIRKEHKDPTAQACRLACFNSCQHHFNPINGIFTRAVDKLGKAYAEGPAFKKAFKFVRREACWFERYFYTPVFTPIMNWYWEPKRPDSTQEKETSVPLPTAPNPALASGPR